MLTSDRSAAEWVLSTQLRQAPHVPFGQIITAKVRGQDKAHCGSGFVPISGGNATRCPTRNDSEAVSQDSSERRVCKQDVLFPHDAQRGTVVQARGQFLALELRIEAHLNYLLQGGHQRKALLATGFPPAVLQHLCALFLGAQLGESVLLPGHAERNKTGRDDQEHRAQERVHARTLLEAVSLHA